MGAAAFALFTVKTEAQERLRPNKVRPPYVGMADQKSWWPIFQLFNNPIQAEKWVRYMGGGAIYRRIRNIDNIPPRGK